MGCTTTTLKFTVIVLNIFCGIFATLVIIASGYCLSSYSESDLTLVPCAVSLVLGSLLFLTIIPGCCGPLRESTRAIWIYAICLWTLMTAQIVVNLVIPLDFDKLAVETVEMAWKADFTNNGTMAYYEVELLCCGKNGPKDYSNSGLSIPSSCYKNQNHTDEANLFTVGCVEKLSWKYQIGERIEVISDWTLVGIEFLTGLMAGLLAINLKNAQRRKLFH